MKQTNTINKALIIGAAALTMVIMGSNALAGSRLSLARHVTITKNADNSGTAVAYLGGVYNGTGVREFLGCDKGLYYCLAEDEAGVFVSCQVSNFLAQTFQSISADSKIRIRWNATGRCTSIEVTHSSEFEDKQG